MATPMTVLPRLVLGLLLSTIIGLIAWRRGSLSSGGVLGAIITGSSLFGFAGFTAGCLLIAFFVSSSALSHYKRRDDRKHRAAQAFDKGSRRDLAQALANGGVASLLALAHWLFEGTNDSLSATCYAGMMSAIATANADTWATELGVLSKTPPRLITAPWRVLPAGASGGVTALGTFCAGLGALWIALVFGVLTKLDISVHVFALPAPGEIVRFMLGTLMGGWLGAMADSALGATVQRMYFSHQRNAETERPREPDGTPNPRRRGLPFINNDLVNFLATAIGAALGMGLFRILPV